MKSKEQIEQAIDVLFLLKVDFNTKNQTGEDIMAAGAHRALNWVLGKEKSPNPDYFENR